jgi:hypothetical protein
MQGLSATFLPLQSSGYAGLRSQRIWQPEWVVEYLRGNQCQQPLWCWCYSFVGMLPRIFIWPMSCWALTAPAPR